MGSDLQDPNYLNGGYKYYWSTNASGLPASEGVNWGVRNQIALSQTAAGIPANSYWFSPLYMPAGLMGIRSAEAAEFAGFFTGVWTYNG
ncbi:MAG TPA: hypothetical protein VF607_05880, partial [Verrucomicrobiae bacterium]